MKSIFSVICFTFFFSSVFSQILEEKEMAVGGHYAFANHKGLTNEGFHGLGMFFDFKGHERVSNFITMDFFLPKEEKVAINVNSYGRNPEIKEATLTSTIAHFSVGYRFYAFNNNNAFDGLLKGLSFELNFGVAIKYNNLQLDNGEQINYSNELMHYESKIKSSLVYALGIAYEYPLDNLTPYIQINRRAFIEKVGEAQPPADELVFFNNSININLGVKIPWN
ncbi:MAG: hypothetical protein ACJAUV_002112 [Flavobacteriales bacterium]|jgi:hypothetical protein